LILKSKFIADESIKTLFIIQENSFIEIPIREIAYEEFLEENQIQSIKEYIENIDSLKERKIIFLKELIDFLSEVKKENRFKFLISNFERFYNRCNISYDYYLSNFSYNKVKLELDNSVLEHSKNLRSIINDSQSKLVAIPAAFVLAISQFDFSSNLSLKNILICISSLIFSYLISIFINNQKNALEIVSDNIVNFKKTFITPKGTAFEEEKELTSLTTLINNSYIKIEREVLKQGDRLDILQYLAWSISIILLILLIFNM
jgi:hypothetical protein